MRDLSVAAKQQSSLELWDSQDRYELVVSDLVLAEASAGDAQAAAARRAWLTNLPILPIGTEAQEIADALVAKGAMPAAALQEIWQIKDAAYDQAGRNSQRFVEQLRQRSAQLRQGLTVKEWPASAPLAASITARNVLPS
jgi:hypothetical protein